MFRRLTPSPALPALPERFGIRSREQLLRDAWEVLRHLPRGDRYTFNVASSALLRPDLSLPAYAGLLPRDGVAPIFNFFDRHGGAHDCTDFVCPPGTPLVAAAPGIVATTRDRWLRGGLTLCIDHGEGVVTQYTHLTKACVEPGQRVERGEPIALSGVTGLDMTQFFPWVPPHVHFMVWVDGEPIDPFLSAGEAPRAGAWADGNDPRTTHGPLPGDPSPREIVSRVDERMLDELCAQCTDPRIAAELEAAPSSIARAAIVEDSLHHDRPAWRAVPRPARVRPAEGDATRVRLTLPLPASLYSRTRAADAPWTRPGPGGSRRRP